MFKFGFADPDTGAKSAEPAEPAEQPAVAVVGASVAEPPSFAEELPARVVTLGADEGGASEEEEAETGAASRAAAFDVVSLCDGQLTLRKTAAHAPRSLAPRGVDIVSGRYEGGFKLWECSVDLAAYLHGRAELLTGRHVLELGAGHALPSLVALRAGAASVTVHDYNEEVVRGVCAHNVRENLRVWGGGGGGGEAGAGITPAERVRFVAGGWSSVHTVACGPRTAGGGGFDTVVAAETVYAGAQTQSFCHAVVRVLRHDAGARAVVAGKRYYFGVGGGMRGLERELHAAAARVGRAVRCDVVWEARDGVSNVREVVVVRWRT